MAGIQLTLLQGTGTVPKNVGLNSLVLCDASGLSGGTYQWTMVSKPEGSDAYFNAPTLSITRLNTINKVGVYSFSVVTDQGAYNEKSAFMAISVPGSISPLPVPAEPTYDTGGSGTGRVRNFSFELPGLLPGHANSWTIHDDADILANFAGTQRGRIMPVNFVMHHGKYVMCLGDDLQNSAEMVVGQEFSISQDIDLRDITTLKIELKLTPAP